MPRLTFKPFAQQAVVVFGASSGIGRATALEFCRRGVREIVIVGRKEEALESLARELGHTGARVWVAFADTASFEEVKAVADLAVREFGRIDTWAHIAGVGFYSRFMDTTPEEFRRVIDVNLMGQVYAAMVALPVMKAHGGGALIHVSSVLAEVPVPFQSAYIAAKHGVKGMIDAMRLEIRHEQLPIAVTNIMPAVIDTPFFEHAPTKLGVAPKMMGPVYTPEAVARAISTAAREPAAGDIIVGGAGVAMVWSRRLFPGLFDALMRRLGFAGQMSDDPKSADAPSELFAAETTDKSIRSSVKNAA